jgi:mannose-6-phosphate isomerase-like protein (cupin superfamily)
VVRGRKA